MKKLNKYKAIEKVNNMKVYTLGMSSHIIYARVFGANAPILGVLVLVQLTLETSLVLKWLVHSVLSLDQLGVRRTGGLFWVMVRTK